MLWLCVAHAKEIPDLRDLQTGGFQIQELGVGQFKSLATFSALATKEKPTRVLLAGSCGSQNRDDLLKIFSCNHFAYPSIAGEELPEFMPRSCATTPAVAAQNFAAATVLQNHGISLSAEKFAGNTGYTPPEYPRPFVENMEAASLAFFCHDHGIAFSALLCVTNTIGPEGRGEWRSNFREAGLRLKAAVQELAR